jgi:hypothetical protein
VANPGYSSKAVISLPVRRCHEGPRA